MPDPRFNGDVEARWLRDGRTMKLLKPFAFIDKNGKEWLAPQGSKVDGASIPKAFWSSVGPPFVGRYRRATVIHDIYCQTRSEPYQAVHRMFYQAMLVDKTPAMKARQIYFAVKHFGPKWDADGNDLVVDFDEDVDPTTLDGP